MLDQLLFAAAIMLPVLYLAVLLYAVYEICFVAELKTWMRPLWLILVVALPLIGLLIYGKAVRARFKLKQRT